MKSPAEKGYLIPVKRQKEPGKYAIGYVKELAPGPTGSITVCLPSGKSTTWTFKNTIPAPEGFKGLAPFSRLKNRISENKS